ncbi:hypothetical protein EGW08_006887 [Elysia chlorotica]|uniref:EF-hand domain-containing protein n=1 Tax=Elysia chlorotica TaxID=188477 RepID=A0A433TUT2_ELYCH|nr:hypothetical protein EGW08_006887 [Elysia chlorotica]
MMLKFVLAVSLVASAYCASLHNLFDAFAGADGFMDSTEFADFWFQFDMDGDGIVSKLEFDSGWNQADFRDKEHAPFFFLEMDRVPDEQLTREDFQHMYNIFESDGDGRLTYQEFRNTFDALFKVD